jgi:glutamine amidotransferase
MTEIAIVDYGLGNLFSVQRAVEAVGGTPQITSVPEDLDRAQAVILPGVGAFGQGMKYLNERGLVEPLRRVAESGKPLLGICLGLQLLMDESEEFGRWEGLGLIPGRVVSMNPDSTRREKVPQIGWNSIAPPADADTRWSDSVLRGLEPGVHMYFVHSYCVLAEREQDVVAETTYGGVRFTSVARNANVEGCQFHPEKSGDGGLQILENFVMRVGSAART